MTFDRKYLIFVTIFISSLIIANVTANRIGDLGFMTLAGSPLCFGVTFLVCDIVNEIYGKEKARFLIKIGLIANIVMLLLIYSVKLLPPAKFALEQDKSFDVLFLTSWRIVLASQLSYFLGNMLDISIFDRLRILIPEFRALRKNISTAISQILDTGLFCSIAFIGVFPIMDIMTIFIGEYIFKVLISFCDTPVFYIITRFTNKEIPSKV